MGDLNAVDIATGAHESVLEYGGALPPDEIMLHWHPPPRGRRMHCSVIDDNVGIAVGTSRRDPIVRAMADMFDEGSIACATDKLPQHEGKRVRGLTTGVALGAELLDGRRLGAERVRRAYLGLISILVAKVGQATGNLLRKLFSSWTFCCLFR